MARQVGFTPRGFTTAQLTALVTKFGPTGTVQANQIQKGTLVRDLTTGKVKVFNGPAFVDGTDYTP